MPVNWGINSTIDSKYEPTVLSTRTRFGVNDSGSRGKTLPTDVSTVRAVQPNNSIPALTHPAFCFPILGKVA